MLFAEIEITRIDSDIKNMPLIESSIFKRKTKARITQPKTYK